MPSSAQPACLPPSCLWRWQCCITQAGGHTARMPAGASDKVHRRSAGQGRSSVLQGSHLTTRRGGWEQASEQGEGCAGVGGPKRRPARRVAPTGRPRKGRGCCKNAGRAMRTGVVGCSSQESARRRMQEKGSKCARCTAGWAAPAEAWAPSPACCSSRSQPCWAVSPAGSAAGAQQAVQHRRAPAGEGWDSCGAAGAQRHETQQTARKQGSTTHEGRKTGSGNRAAAQGRPPAPPLRQAS